MTVVGGRARIQAALDANRPALAVELAEASLAEHPDDATLHTLLAVAHRAAGDQTRAREAADRALSLDQADPWIWHVAALTRFDSKRDRPEGIELLKRALQLEPDFVPSHVTMASVLAQIAFNRRGRENLAKADRHANEAMRLAPESADGYHAMALVCRARGDASGAHWFATEAVRRDPSNARARAALAEAAADTGDLRSAGDHYVAAGRLEPSGRSLKGLRGLRVNLPIGIFGLWVVLRLAAGIASALGYSGRAVALGTAMILAVLALAYVAIRRLLTLRKLSPEARRVLATDRRQRMSRRLGRFRR